jgi:glyoxylase-like metal-dependent hydrolase (beta-lactamase superfamily II)
MCEKKMRPHGDASPSFDEGRSQRISAALAFLVGTLSLAGGIQAPAQSVREPQSAARELGPIIPSTATGTRTGMHEEAPDSAKAPAIDLKKGYRVQLLGRGLYMVTENVYQSMFLVYEEGVVLVDAPPSLATFINAAVTAVTSKPITHIIYTHAHADHIAGTGRIGAPPVIIAHTETKRLLERDHDSNRPLPTQTFTDKLSLHLGSQVLELSYHGNAHEPGNMFVYAPEQRVLMVVDVIFPGWMPYRAFALAQDIPGYFRQVAEIEAMDFDVLVAGHVTRTGTKADVILQREFNDDLKAATGRALKSTLPGIGLDPLDKNNPWAFADNFAQRVAVQCANALTEKWAGKLAGFDVFIRDQCLSMQQSLLDD